MLRSFLFPSVRHKILSYRRPAIRLVHGHGDNPIPDVKHKTTDELNERAQDIARRTVIQKELARFKVEYHNALSTKFNDDTKWVRIYSYPHATKLGFFVRTNRNISLLSIGTAIVCLINNLSWVNIITLGSCGFLGLIICGDLCRKIICQVYISEDERFVRLCRLTFQGKRRDLVLPIESVIPLSETNTTNRKLFSKLKFHIPENINLDYDYHEFYDEKFFISTTTGDVLDMEAFEKVFGSFMRLKAM